MRRELQELGVACIAGLASSDGLASEAAKYGGSDACIASISLPSRASVMSVSGRARWYDYHYYSRTVWWSMTCASSADHSESLGGSPIWRTVPHDAQAYPVQIDVEADSDRDAFNRSATLTNRAARALGLLNR